MAHFADLNYCLSFSPLRSPRRMLSPKWKPMLGAGEDLVCPGLRLHCAHPGLELGPIVDGQKPGTGGRRNLPLKHSRRKRLFLSHIRFSTQAAGGEGIPGPGVAERVLSAFQKRLVCPCGWSSWSTGRDSSQLIPECLFTDLIIAVKGRWGWKPGAFEAAWRWHSSRGPRCG